MLESLATDEQRWSARETTPSSSSFRTRGRRVRRRVGRAPGPRLRAPTCNLELPDQGLGLWRRVRRASGPRSRVPTPCNLELPDQGRGFQRRVHRAPGAREKLELRAEVEGNGFRVA